MTVPMHMTMANRNIFQPHLILNTCISCIGTTLVLRQSHSSTVDSNATKPNIRHC